MQVLLRKRSTASKTAAISFAMKATLCLALVGIASASFIRSGSEARNNLAAGNNNVLSRFSNSLLRLRFSVKGSHPATANNEENEASVESLNPSNETPTKDDENDAKMSDFDRFLDEFDIEEEERELRKKGKKKSSKPLKTKIQESSNNDNLRQCLQEVFSESASRDQNEKNTAVNKKKKKKTKSKKNSKTKNTKKGNSRYLLEDDIDDDKRDASALIDFIQSFD
eukprot:CAMPEP_0201120170 /NCGR_PEP_ID=MMETSP0850-20130426/4259_1 /ASSEMBLY_ACC=CAM_ASM_000622 /TAXON_ID=183588 /ORGANISM="Pseudo-nitzschia fraudulenta, Strain WWA7" /LENGTH=224 /DNA_ID=CAMNT_0047386199 /DNA_START=253 /DNA_END=925 /DNA_ORIENTATION=+